MYQKAISTIYIIYQDAIFDTKRKNLSRYSYHEKGLISGLLQLFAVCDSSDFYSIVIVLLKADGAKSYPKQARNMLKLKSMQY